MKMVPMGKLLLQLRKQKKWTQTRLGEGIVSKSEISRIENGEREPDVFQLQEFVRRLGQSLRYFEIVVTGAENELFCLREDMEHCLSAGEFEKADRKIKEYEALVERENKARYHKAYIKEMRKAISDRRRDSISEPPAFKRIVFLEQEALKKIRAEKGWSQEQVGGFVCTRETVSKIENGRAPSHKNLKHLRSKLGNLQYVYYGYVIAKEFSVYERVEEYQNLLTKNPEEAKLVLPDIRKKLDLKHPVNCQFVESSEIPEQLRQGKISPAEAMVLLERCLRLTMPEYDGNIYRMPHCQERVILDEIIRCLEQVGRREAADNLRKSFKIEESFVERYSNL